MQAWVPAVIAQIAESDWRPLADYPEGGEAQIADITVGHRRLVVRRTRLVGPQAELFPDWRHFAFLTNRSEALEVVEREHRQHTVIELTIRDLKDQALAHFPSGRFNAKRRLDGERLPRAQLLRWTAAEHRYPEDGPFRRPGPVRCAARARRGRPKCRAACCLKARLLQVSLALEGRSPA